MDNAVRALEYAFAILIFVIALSSTMYMLSGVKTTSDTVFSEIDTKRFYEDAEIPEDELTPEGNIKYKGRIVSIDTILPTLYRYYKEDYIVEFYNKDNEKIISFDLAEETATRQIWTGNPAKATTTSESDVKKRLDLFLNGSSDGTGVINSNKHNLHNDIAFVKKDVVAGTETYVINPTDKNYIVTKGFYNYCKGKKFSEEYAYVPEVSDKSLDENVTKMVIRYVEQS